MNREKEQKKPVLATRAGAGKTGKPVENQGCIHYSTPRITGQASQIVRDSELQTRLAILAARIGLSPQAIVEILIRGANPQLVNVCTSLTPRAAASDWRRGRVIPLSFVSAEVGP